MGGRLVSEVVACAPTVAVIVRDHQTAPHA
jgi:hypothetical protein